METDAKTRLDAYWQRAQGGDIYAAGYLLALMLHAFLYLSLPEGTERFLVEQDALLAARRRLDREAPDDALLALLHEEAQAYRADEVQQRAERHRAQKGQ